MNLKEEFMDLHLYARVVLVGGLLAIPVSLFFSSHEYGFNLLYATFAICVGLTYICFTTLLINIVLKWTDKQFDKIFNKIKAKWKLEE